MVSRLFQPKSSSTQLFEHLSKNIHLEILYLSCFHWPEGPCLHTSFCLMFYFGATINISPSPEEPCTLCAQHFAQAPLSTWNILLSLPTSSMIYDSQILGRMPRAGLAAFSTGWLCFFIIIHLEVSHVDGIIHRTASPSGWNMSGQFSLSSSPYHID